MQETVVIVPSFNPDEKLSALLHRLIEAGFGRIVLVNDGSLPECEPIFKEAQALGAVVLRHAVNQGKGRALKTAFHYLLNQYGDGVLAVCADGDGQHTISDILAVSAALAQRPEALILGCRQFADKTIPFRSRFGNRLTRRVFQLFCGVKVSDTQTGLRGLSGAVMRTFLSTSGERFEYEMNMLIDSREKQIPICEVPIRTVYIEENRTSHFHPLRDSVRIYAVFARFLLSSLTASGVDLLLFWLLSMLFVPFDQTLAIFLATFLARTASSLVNYRLNRKRVFQLQRGRLGVLFKYYLLCGIQLLCSAGLVAFFTGLLGGEKVLWKIPVDLLLFVLSFVVQREWVFRKM